MKVFKFVFMVSTMVVAMIAVSCGTNEANYRKAYDKAMEKRADVADNTIFNRVRQQSRVEKAVIEDGDTVNVAVEYVSAVSEAGFEAQQLHRYNVVVAQFKQLFHAKSLRNRMAAGGYADVIIVQTGEPLYYVVTLSSDSLLEVNVAAEKIKASSPVGLRKGFPYLLRASNR